MKRPGSSHLLVMHVVRLQFPPFSFPHLAATHPSQSHSRRGARSSAPSVSSGIGFSKHSSMPDLPHFQRGRVHNFFGGNGSWLASGRARRDSPGMPAVALHDGKKLSSEDSRRLRYITKEKRKKKRSANCISVSRQTAEINTVGLQLQ